MKSAGKKPTMKDVAREAGVSLGTVSNVFNDVPVGPEYKERVEKAALRLGYRVNSYARGLRAEKTNTIAVILPGIRNMFFASLADAICSELTQKNCRMLLATTQYDPQAEIRCLQMLQQNMVDGIIGLTYTANPLDVKDMPYVSIDRILTPAIPCVTSDNYSGGILAANRLIDLGCRNLLFLRIGSHILGETDKRGSGFAAQCGLRNVPVTMQRFDDEDGISAIHRYLEAHISEGKLAFDGIFCSTDHLLMQLLPFLRERGIRVPKDVQLIGYDGMQQFFSEGYVGSTIVQPLTQIAETSVDLLLNWGRTRTSALICLPVTYVPGGTTREEVTPPGQ